MPRRKLLYSSVLPYHLCGRVNNREPFPGELNFAWNALTSELYLQALLHKARVHAFVLMPSHFHLLATFPETNISRVMQGFMSSSTRIMNARYGRVGHLFGGRYHWTMIENPLYFAHALKYVYRNPVKAGICARVEDYPFSTWAGLEGNAFLPVAIQEPLLDFDKLMPTREFLGQWLNSAHRAEENEAIKKALKRKEFNLGVNPRSRKFHTLDAP